MEKTEDSTSAALRQAAEKSFREFRLRDAAAVADVAAMLAADGVQRAGFLAVAKIARAYGSFLLSTPTAMRPPKLRLELLQMEVPWSGILQEATRLEQRYERALRSAPGTAFVQWLHAYHAAANLDGLRAMLWLHRAIAAIDTTVTVDTRLRRLDSDLRQNLDTAVGRAGGGGHVVEIYAALQMVNDALHQLEPEQQGPIDRVREFALHIDLTANGEAH